MPINGCENRVSMLLSLLLANIKILSGFFFLFFVVLSNFFTIPIAREKNRVKLALAIPKGAPKTLVNEQIDIPPVVALKTSLVYVIKSSCIFA